MNGKRPTPRHIIKCQRLKAENLKSTKRKTVICKGASIKLSADFSTETLQVRRDWQEIFKVMKSKDLQPKLHYPAKLPFRIQEHIKSFPNKK